MIIYICIISGTGWTIHVVCYFLCDWLVPRVIIHVTVYTILFISGVSWALHVIFLLPCDWFIPGVIINAIFITLCWLTNPLGIRRCLVCHSVVCWWRRDSLKWRLLISKSTVVNIFRCSWLLFKMTRLLSEKRKNRFTVILN